MDRDKLPIKTNIPLEGQLVFDDPRLGASQHGEYRIYCVKYGGVEYSWFASEQAHEMIQEMGLKKGPITILREEFDGSDHPRFRINGKIYDDVFPKEPGPEYFGPDEQPPSDGPPRDPILEEILASVNYIKGWIERQAEPVKLAPMNEPDNDDVPF